MRSQSPTWRLETPSNSATSSRVRPSSIQRRAERRWKMRRSPVCRRRSRISWRCLAFSVTVFITYRPAIGFGIDSALDLTSTRVIIGSSGTPRLYTTAKRLVLQRNQKTRGRFYRFLLYDVNHGRVHWAFYPGKGATYVCRFLRQIRRWYPRGPLRLALDRDPAHPIKARATRAMMRRLHLNWTSLPKRSPDDNPCETIFSDIQQNVLDTTNDPDQGATKGRISRHLRSRNRRSDRFIRISYLEKPRRRTHKN